MTRPRATWERAGLKVGQVRVGGDHLGGGVGVITVQPLVRQETTLSPLPHPHPSDHARRHEVCEHAHVLVGGISVRHRRAMAPRLPQPCREKCVRMEQVSRLSAARAASSQP